jgi:hypothetical protein
MRQPSKKANKSKHVIALTLGRLPTLSLRGGWQFPEPRAVALPVFLPRLHPQFFLGAIERPFGNTFLWAKPTIKRTE